MSIRTVIADDHAIFRSGLKALLEKSGDVEVIAEAGNGFEAIRAVAGNQIDLLLLDLGMPGLHGSKVAETVAREHPRVAIVVLTMHEDCYYLRELFRVGVRAFVLKKSSRTSLMHAIRSAYSGQRYVDPALSGNFVSSFVGRKPGGENGRLSLLSPREQEVCTLLAYGHTNAEIAGRLCISERTVETHRSSIMAKLDLNTRAELVRFALGNGLLKLN